MAREAEGKNFFINLDITTQERFDMSRFMRFDGDVFDPLASNVISSIKNLESGGQYTVQGHDFRPDAVSDIIYGTSEYWWVLLLYNDKLSFNDLQHGDEITFPSIQALEDMYFRLKIDQNKVDKD